MIVISASQCRAARGLLKWSQPDLSARSSVNVQTISAFENESGSPTKKTLQKIATSFEKENIEFLTGDGVKKLDTSVRILNGEDSIQTLLDDIYETSKNSKEDILIANSSEPLPTDPQLQDVINHIKRLKKHNICEKILCLEGDTNFLGPLSSYRWIPKDNFCDIPTFIYGSKIALVIWGPSAKVTIINNPLYAKSVRSLFNFAWEHARLPEMRE